MIGEGSVHGVVVELEKLQGDKVGDILGNGTLEEIVAEIDLKEMGHVEE